MKTLLIGTNNPSKLGGFKSHLSGIAVQCVTPAELGLHEIPAENARTAADNALEKAKAWHKASGLPVITEDSGLVFLDLPADHPDQPGVMVRRASGHVMDDEEMLSWYQQIIKKHGGRLRAAWEDAWCVLKNEEEYLIHADSPEKLLHHARLMIDVPCKKRLPGWPLDSLTYFPQIGKYKAEMTIEEMNAATAHISKIAERDRQQLIDWLQSAIGRLV